jgi:hypothetical protein
VSALVRASAFVRRACLDACVRAVKEEWRGRGNVDLHFRYMQHVSLVIACHESEPKIRDTLRGALSAGFIRRNVSLLKSLRRGRGRGKKEENRGGIKREVSPRVLS